MLFNCLAPRWIFHATLCRKQTYHSAGNVSLLVIHGFICFISLLTLFCATLKASRKYILSRNLWAEMAPVLSVRRKEASFMKNDFNEVKKTQNRAQRMPHLEQITICVCGGCCFHAISHFSPLCMNYIDEVQESFPLTERGWIRKSACLASEFIFCWPPRPHKPCVGLINQVHVSLTDTRWLKQCMIKKSCSIHLECTQLNKPHLARDINDNNVKNRQKGTEQGREKTVIDSSWNAEMAACVASGSRTSCDSDLQESLLWPTADWVDKVAS